VWTVAVSADNRFASAGFDRTLAIGSLDGGGPPAVQPGHRDGVNQVVFSRDGKLVATASDDETARVWTAAGTTELDVHRSVNAIDLSPDATELVTGAHDGSVRAWSIAQRTSRVIARHHAPVRSVAYSPDGRHIASGGLDSAVWLVDRATATARVYVADGPVNRVAFSPDGTQLAAAGADLQVWSVAPIAPAFTTARVDADGEIGTP
jgi:WD40 repeat protein